MTAGRPLAVVTGATSGIGAAFAAALAARGCDLLVTGRRRELIEAQARRLRDEGVSVEVVLADFAEPAALSDLEDRIRSASSLRYLVNNAGYGSHGGFLEESVEEATAMLRVHAEATVRLSHAAAGRMAGHGGGAIINVSSLAAFLSAPGCVMYCATKAMLVSFSESLALACRGTGVDVMALCPGFTRTDFHARLSPEDSQLAGRGLVRWMTAEQVVTSALRALDRGRIVHIPGFTNRLLLSLIRLIPRRLRYALAAKAPQ